MLDWATGIIEKAGYVGVIFGMFLENIFPPIPSELIMFFSGASAAKGDLNILLVILAGILGSALGLLPWYYGAEWFGKERVKKFTRRHGRWLTLAPQEVDKAEKWFKEHGKKAVVIGRFLPAIRTLIAIPAAITGMHIKLFIFLALLGSGVYDGVFAVFGYLSEESSETLKKYLDISTYIILGIVVIWYTYRVITFKKKLGSS